MSSDIKNDLSMSAFDIFIAAISVCQPVAAVAGASTHLLLNAYNFWNARKIDLFIEGINRDEVAAENFRKLLFDGSRKTEHACRLISDIFRMETERKVECFSFAGINFSNKQKRLFFTETDFFRAGFVLANTLSEDLKFMHSCDLTHEYNYSECVQGLVSAGLIYPSTDDKYRFTTFAKKIDFFALDMDGSKYGIESKFSPLTDPVYQFHIRFG